MNVIYTLLILNSIFGIATVIGFRQDYAFNYKLHPIRNLFIDLLLITVGWLGIVLFGVAMTVANNLITIKEKIENKVR